MSGLTDKAKEFQAASSFEGEQKAANEMVEAYFASHTVDTHTLRAHGFYIHWQALCQAFVDQFPDQLSDQDVASVPRKLTLLMIALRDSALESFKETPISYLNTGLMYLACMSRGKIFADPGDFDPFGLVMNLQSAYESTYADLGPSYRVILALIAEPVRSKQDLKKLISEKISTAPLTKITDIAGKQDLKDQLLANLKAAKAEQRKIMFDFMFAAFKADIFTGSYVSIRSEYRSAVIDLFAADINLFRAFLKYINTIPDGIQSFYDALPYSDEGYILRAYMLRLEEPLRRITWIAEEIGESKTRDKFLRETRDATVKLIHACSTALGEMSTEKIRDLFGEKAEEYPTEATRLQMVMLVTRPEILDWPVMRDHYNSLMMRPSEYPFYVVQNLLLLNDPKLTMNILILRLSIRLPAERDKILAAMKESKDYSEALNILIAAVLPNDWLKPPASAELQEYFLRAIADRQQLNKMLDILPSSTRSKGGTRSAPREEISKDIGPISQIWSMLAQSCTIPESKSAAANAARRPSIRR